MFTNMMLALADPKIDIDVHKDGGHAWFQNPLTIGIGIVILLLVVLFSVTAARRA